MTVILALLPCFALAQDRLVRLYAPPELVESGLLKHILPRFSLKTQTRVELVTARAEADFTLGDDGRPVFEGLGRVWAASHSESAATTRLLDWMVSDVGRRTIFGFTPEGAALFTAPSERVAVAEAVVFGEDAKAGLLVAKAKCARCHAVDDATRKTTIGSTPSFFVLRSFDDWEARFSGFFTLKPHPAFTQIADVTEPFPAERPSPIVPVEMTVDEVFAIVAYVEAIKAADLGEPLQHQ